jgi:hypothetical protein
MGVKSVESINENLSMEDILKRSNFFSSLFQKQKRKKRGGSSID